MYMASEIVNAAEPSVLRPPGAFRRLVRRHPWWVDGVVASAYLIPTLSLNLLLFYPNGQNPSPWLVVALSAGTLIIAAALLFRRHRPIGMLVVVTAVSIAELVVGGSVDALPLALALYAVAVFVSTRTAWVASAITVPATVASAFLVDLIPRSYPNETLQASPSGESIPFAVFSLIAVSVGASIGDRRRYVAALVDRADDLARERDQQAQLATAAERARITRELHDIVAHSLSVMVTLADGADAMARKDPERSAGAIREIGEVGRRSLAEMRRLLGVLAAPDSEVPLAPQPVLDDLEELAATFRTAGLPVSIEIAGHRPDSAALQATVYRIVKEALTNALRYAAAPSRVVVRVEFGVSGGAVTVTDDGRPSSTSTPSIGSGRGLIGMRERASAYGGVVEAGPHRDGGWRVHVTLPESRDR